MAKSWANSGIDLHLDVRGGPVRAGLERALREAVQSGRLRPGTRLPPSRALAVDLGVARNTVVEAYGQLVAEGWLTARQGSGTRVAARVVPPADSAPPAGDGGTRPPGYDLRAGFPNLSAFPHSAWLAASRRALMAVPAGALGYGDPRGRPELRTALAGYLARSRGVRATPERIVVCSGFGQGLSLLSRVLRDRGATSLAVEAYGHARHRDAVAAAGLEPRPVPVDGRGVATGQLGDAGGVLLTPAHQFPLGVTLSARRRTEVVGWAHDTGGLVIEDDYDGEFRYDRQPVGALQAMAPEHVVYAGTASKSLAPALRLGWLVLPARLVDEVAAAAQLAGGPSVLGQLTLADLVARGGYDRQVRRCRLVYRRRRDRLVAVLDRQVPGARVTGIAAGMHALLDLPGNEDEEQVVSRAARHGVAVQGLGAFAAGESTYGPALVVGYGTPPDHAYTIALARLCAALVTIPPPE